LAAADPGEGAAAAIKKSEAEAKARRAAARYLGTVDCHWWPEAQNGLIDFLWGDPNECVRLEAALALGRGCCCTKEVIYALIPVVQGIPKDGKPAENSERVRAAAAAALAHCLGCYHAVERVDEKKEPSGTRPASLSSQDKLPLSAVPAKPLSAFSKKVQAIPMEDLIEEGRRVLAKTSTSVAPPGMAQEGRGHGLIEVVAKAISSSREARRSSAGYNPIAAEQKAVTPAPELAATHREPAPEVKPAAHQEPVPLPSPPSAPAADAGLGSTTVAAAPQTASTPPADAGSASSYGPALALPRIHNGTGGGSSYCPTASVPPAPSSGEEKHSVSVDESTAPDGAVVNHRQMLALLKDSMYPEQRAWAADNMANFDWHISPEIAEGLIATARKDTVTAVRVASIRCLVKMNINTPEALAALEALKTDGDNWVCAEADKALTKLAPAQTGSSGSPEKSTIGTKASFTP
jgi:hypothetical protein